MKVWLIDGLRNVIGGILEAIVLLCVLPVEIIKDKFGGKKNMEVRTLKRMGLSPSDMEETSEGMRKWFEDNSQDAEFMADFPELTPEEETGVPDTGTPDSPKRTRVPIRSNASMKQKIIRRPKRSFFVPIRRSDGDMDGDGRQIIPEMDRMGSTPLEYLDAVVAELIEFTELYNGMDGEFISQRKDIDLMVEFSDLYADYLELQSVIQYTEEYNGRGEDTPSRQRFFVPIRRRNKLNVEEVSSDRYSTLNPKNSTCVPVRRKQEKKFIVSIYR